MNGIARRIGILLGTALSLACARESNVEKDVVEDVKETMSRGDPILATARVENGVTVYEHAPGAFDRAPQWRLDPAPVATIDGTVGEAHFDLTGFSSAVLLSDGRVMTFAQDSHKVVVFSRDGKGERVIGSGGLGPGQWMRFGDPVLLENDTVLVLDSGNSRLNWVTPDGGIVRTVPYDLRGGLYTHRIAGLISSGELLMHTAGSCCSQPTDGRQRSLATLVAASVTTPQLPVEVHGRMGNTRFIGTLPDQPGGEVETRYGGRVVKSWRSFRLGGMALLAAWDSVYASVEASSRSIELRDPLGLLRARIDVPVTRRVVTKEMRDAQVESELKHLNAPGSERHSSHDEMERLARESPFADSLPYFAHLFTSIDGALWVVDAIASTDSSWTATALGKDGSILGRLTAVGRSVPMAFGANQVIVRTDDGNGVVRLHVCRFTDTR